MCFILVGLKVRPDYPLVIAANRDEFLQRPTASAHWWHHGFLAGKDIEQGGTWLGVSKSGRFAAVTNLRSPANIQSPRSRGELVSGFLRGKISADAYYRSLESRLYHYRPFNLLTGDLDGLYYFNNRHKGLQELTPGVYGLSNAFLDTPWPKMVDGKHTFANHLNLEKLDTEGLFGLLRNPHTYTDDELPQSDLDRHRERQLSAIFIEGEQYATRSSTVLLFRNNGDAYYEERSYSGRLEGPDQCQFEFKLETGQCD